MIEKGKKSRAKENGKWKRKKGKKKKDRRKNLMGFGEFIAALQPQKAKRGLSWP